MYKQMLNDYDVCPHEKAIIYSMLGRMYIGMGDFEHAIYYMALSAIQDIRSATRETTAKKNFRVICMAKETYYVPADTFR